jgi:hypothetical protein
MAQRAVFGQRPAAGGIRAIAASGWLTIVDKLKLRLRYLYKLSLFSNNLASFARISGISDHTFRSC